jgi:hypothetical protein
LDEREGNDLVRCWLKAKSPRRQFGGQRGAGEGIIMRLQFNFLNDEKECMLRVLAKYSTAPDHHSEIIEKLKVDGSTVLSKMEARYLAGVICPYYVFLADRIFSHPCFGALCTCGMSDAANQKLSDNLCNCGAGDASYPELHADECAVDDIRYDWKRDREKYQDLLAACKALIRCKDKDLSGTEFICALVGMELAVREAEGECP